MTEFPVHNKDSAAKEARQTLEVVERTFGFIPNLLGVMAGSPALAEAYIALSDIFERKSALTAIERQVVLLTVSRFHECRYCMAAHSMTATMAEVPTEVIDALRQDRPLADSKLEALRHLVVDLVESRGWPARQVLQDFYDAGYRPEQVLDVLVGVGQKTLSNYTNHLAGTPVDSAMEAHTWSPPG